MDRNKIIEDFERALRRDKEMANRYPNDPFYHHLAKNTEECLKQLKGELKKFNLHIRNN